MTYLRRLVFPRSPYEQPIKPALLVICLIAGGAVAIFVMAVGIFLKVIGLLFRLAFRR